MMCTVIDGSALGLSRPSVHAARLGVPGSYARAGEDTDGRHKWATRFLR